MQAKTAGLTTYLQVRRRKELGDIIRMRVAGHKSGGVPTLIETGGMNHLRDKMIMMSLLLSTGASGLDVKRLSPTFQRLWGHFPPSIACLKLNA